jgi:hypothetical protein
MGKVRKPASGIKKCCRTLRNGLSLGEKMERPRMDAFSGIPHLL